MSVEVLYKYGGLGPYSESLFKTPTIWFGAPGSLNDPFECRAWFNFDGTEEQIVGSLVRTIQRGNPKLSATDPLAEALWHLRSGKHKDPTFWDFMRKDVAELLSKNIGMCCLTKTNSNILMWSHYAADHQGYCLEFSASETTPFFGEAQEVKYSPTFPVVDFFTTPHEKQVDLLFLTKYDGWQYEEEYRIVDHQGGPGLHEYPAELLKSVTFGLRMRQEDKEKIRQWLEVRGHAVKLYEATVHEREFKVVPLEVP